MTDRTQKAILTDVLSGLLDGVTSVSLTTYPNHWNVGDSVIWHATIELLTSLGIDVNYICTHDTYSKEELARHNPSGPILICGGGNFGDVYENEVSLRASVLRDFPERKIIQLPQSIWFTSVEAEAAMAELIAACSDFTLLVREHQSYEIATRAFDCPVIECPDTAFFLEGALDRYRSEPTVDVMYLVRADVEAGPAIPEPPAGVTSIRHDWLQEDRAYRRRFGVRGFVAYAIVWRWLNKGWRLPMWLIRPVANELAKRRTLAGIPLLDQGRTLVTDRLHAGILGALLGRRTVLVNNSYNKNGAVYAYSLTGYPNARFAEADALGSLTDPELAFAASAEGP